MKPVLKSATSTCPQCGAEARPLLFSFAGPAHCKNCGTYFVIEPVFKVPEPAPASTEPPNPLLLENLKRPRADSPLANAWGAVGLGIAWIIISSLILWNGMYVFTWENQDYNRLLREGRPAMATITHLDAVHSDDSTRYSISYRFIEPVNGARTRFDDRQDITQQLYSTLRIGQQIEILYAASDPSVSAVKAAFERPISIWSLLLLGGGGLFLLIGLWLLYDSLRGVYQLNRLRSQGCQAQGVIFDRWVDVNQMDENQSMMSYFVAFAFRVPMRGSPMDGKLITRAERNEKAYDRYHTGDTLTIRYLPDNPSICEMVMDG